MKPSIPKGTRDFSPDEMAKRNFIFDTIREVFHRYGYQGIETPAMENLTTLEGKYGDEGDKLLFRVLNSGPVLLTIQSKGADQIKRADLAEKGLRYDLTVPFARYVVMHQNEITFPFKRYQMQPVWRADRPQKGRYREFYQCDADVIGSPSLVNEVELVLMIHEVFNKLGLKVVLKMNNRKILTGLAEVVGEQDRIIDITVALDKLDKIGIEGVNNELVEKGITADAIDMLQPIIKFEGNYNEKIDLLKNLLMSSNTGRKGIEEVEEIASMLTAGSFELDITLARGLNYYTGAIFEVKADGVQIGSVCGGGRYDDLTGIFGLPNVSGVGVSFGIDRICDVMEELKRFETLGIRTSSSKVLLTHFDKNTQKYCMGLASSLRAAGISTEVYPDITKKIVKQFEYANKKQIPFVVVVGEEEMQRGQVNLKNMSTGEQHPFTPEQLIEQLV